MITFRQTNPASKTDPHAVTQQVISPLSAGGLLQEITQTGTIREFLFEMTKDGETYWIGAAVPQGTVDFSKVHVFFHPTVRQRDKVVAKDEDYRTFTGGWSANIQRYVEAQGGQLAGARLTPLIVPFMTMAANQGDAPAYMFATNAMETLNAIMTAVRDQVIPGAVNPVVVSKMAVSSYSSGVGAMRLFIRTFGGTGLIAETTDFDSPFIIGLPKIITRSPGAPGRVFSQEAPAFPQAGWTTTRPEMFRNIVTRREKGPHAQIGTMMFYMAALISAV
jgi:hypothetical protein